jgi:hypothetical protein
LQARDKGRNSLSKGGTIVEGFMIRRPDRYSDSTVKFEVEFQDNNDGTHTGRYNCTVSGDYSVIISIEGRELQNSPYVLRVLPNAIGQMSILDTSSVVQHNSVVGTPFTMIFQAFDSFGNQRTVGGDDLVVKFSLQQFNTTSSSFGSVEDFGNGTYALSGFMTKSGPYTVTVSCDGKPFPRSTDSFDFIVLPGKSVPSHATMHGPALHTAVAGNKEVVIIKMRDEFYNEAVAGGDNISVSLTQLASGGKMPTSKSIDLSVHDQGNGTYVLHFEPKLTGEYSLRVTLGAESDSIDILGSPAVINVMPGTPFGANSFLIGGRSSFIAGSSVFFVLHTKDEMNNTCAIGGAEVTASLSSGRVNETYTVEIKDEGNGRYLIKLTVMKIGEYTLKAFVDGDPALVGNATFAVLPAETNAENTLALIQQIYESEAGVEISFGIKTLDLYGNPTPGSDGIMTAYLSFNNSDIIFGTYSPVDRKCRIVPTRAGSASLSVEFNHQHVQGSPRTIVIVGTWTSSIKTEVFGNGLVKATAGEMSNFDVIPRDQFGNPSTKGAVNVEVTDPEGYLLSINYDQIDQERYNVTYTPSATGVHQISVSVEDNHAPGSPFSVLVKPGPTDPFNSQVFGNGIAEARIGRTCEFIVVARDSLGNLRSVGGDVVEVSARNDKDISKLVVFQIIDLGVGMYRVSYIAPQIEMTISISVLMNGQIVSGHEFHVEVGPDGEPQECPNACSNQGACNSKTGLCVCYDGWIGLYCNIPHISCPDRCNGRGDCDYSTGICQCTVPGFLGNACECFNGTCFQVIPELNNATHQPLCFNDCSGHGSCASSNTCLCDVGFNGAGCEIRTEYSVIPLESGFSLVYEISTGRLFAQEVRVPEDNSCLGLSLFPGSRPQFFNTSFILRPPFRHLVHIGENQVLEFDPLSASAKLLAFKTHELQEKILGNHVSEHSLAHMPILRDKELTYLGMNRLLISTASRSEIWIVDRQNEEIFVDQVGSVGWTNDDASLPRITYIGSDLIVRYSALGAYRVFFFNRATSDIQFPALNYGTLPYLADLNANGSLAIISVSKDFWAITNLRNTDYRGFYCPIQKPVGFSGCSFLNEGNLIQGFSCSANLITSNECKNVSVVDCLNSQKCGYCVSSKQCMTGLSTGPIETVCPQGWVFSSASFSSRYAHVGHDQVLSLDTQNGKYQVLSLARNLRAQSCPMLTDIVAKGTFQFNPNHQVIFSGSDLIVDFDPSFGEISMGECDATQTIMEARLHCQMWGTGVYPRLRLTTLAVFTIEPTLLVLAYSKISGDYSIWELNARTYYESGGSLLKAEPLATGNLPGLANAEIAFINNTLVISHQPVTSTTSFYRLDAKSQLEVVGKPLVGGIQVCC